MECRACERSDSSRRFYCHNCVSTRLAEHYQLRSKLRTLISHVSAKALDLLTPPGGDEAKTWGVQEERELKAERFAKGSRLRDARLAVEKGKEENALTKAALEARKQALQTRRQNLTRARDLLTTLNSPTHSTSTSNPPPPSALSSLNSQYTILTRSLNDLNTRIEDTRMILVRELLVVYALQANQESVNPFLHSRKSVPSSPTKRSSKSKETHPTSSSASSLSSLTSSSSASISTPAPYLLGTLPLPLLPFPSSSSPSSATFAILPTLLHLTRLLALYYSLPLPFTPLPNLYGPGKPGIRSSPTSSIASPGWPLYLEVEGEEKEKHKRELDVRKGLAALVYDLCWIVWKRGGEIRDVEDARDLGKMIMRAVGLTALPTTTRPQRPPLPSIRPSSATFPLDFQVFLDTFASEDHDVSGEDGKDRLRRRLEKGVMVDRERGDDDSEWDLV